MKAQDREKKITDLFERWQKARPEYELNSNRFTEDGISDYEKWESSKPKVMFLLKEEHSEDWEPQDGFSVLNTPFSKNIARWKQIISDMYSNRDSIPDIDTMVLPTQINDLAIVEIKKKNENKGTSNNTEIREFAIKDQAFIKEEIDIIDPNVVICTRETLEYYGDIIYCDDNWQQLSVFNNCQLYKHQNRLVVSMYHPSTRSGVMERKHFNTLVTMIKESNAFSHIDW